MPSLKDLRLRIKSVKSTQKITSAMKMVAAAKLRKAQEKAEAARPYALGLERLLVNALAQQPDMMRPPLLMTGNPDNPIHLIVVVTSDRGLCGGFNVNITRDVRHLVKRLQENDVPVRILCVGRKGRDLLRRDFGDLILETITDVGRKGITMEESERVCQKLQELLDYDICGGMTVVYSVFKSALSQEVARRQLIPIPIEGKSDRGLFEFEPSQEELIDRLVPKNFAVQMYQILIETNASEQGARMTAMDNATRNARDVIKRLELNYNRTRQAYITKELIEIISGAEAL
ncbi:MAG: F0F1 ATP synthase subunit gamma [Candidatus Paracaedibacteraceae bacterium]|nr:F0F1 ATP synthase subunit gamma [Candidatus Paracaedibacteraceae bacterium]